MRKRLSLLAAASCFISGLLWTLPILYPFFLRSAPVLLGRPYWLKQRRQLARGRRKLLKYPSLLKTTLPSPGCPNMYSLPRQVVLQPEPTPALLALAWIYNFACPSEEHYADFAGPQPQAFLPIFPLYCLITSTYYHMLSVLFLGLASKPWEERQILTVGGSLPQLSPAELPGKLQSNKSLPIYTTSTDVVVVSICAEVLTWATKEVFACCHGSDCGSSGKYVHINRRKKTPQQYYHQSWARELYTNPLIPLWESIHILVGIGKSVEEYVPIFLTTVTYRLEFMKHEEWK